MRNQRTATNEWLPTLPARPAPLAGTARRPPNLA